MATYEEVSKRASFFDGGAFSQYVNLIYTLHNYLKGLPHLIPSRIEL